MYLLFYIHTHGQHAAILLFCLFTLLYTQLFNNAGSLPTPGVTSRSNLTYMIISPIIETLTQANRFIVSYQRQDLNVPLDVEYQEAAVTGGNTDIVKETSIPGVMYLVLMWAVHGSLYSPTPVSFKQLLHLAQGEPFTITSNMDVKQPLSYTMF